MTEDPTSQNDLSSFDSAEDSETSDDSIDDVEML